MRHTRGLSTRLFLALALAALALPAWAVPYVPVDLPARIEAENYNLGGENVGYHDTSGGNSGGQYRSDDVDIEGCSEGGYNVGWTAGGEWLAFDVSAPVDATYNILARVAGYADTSLQINLDGASVGTLSVPNTGGWQSWTNSSILTGVPISAGDHEIKVTYAGGNFNINYLDVLIPPPDPVGRLSVHGNQAFGAAYAVDPGTGDIVGPVNWKIEQLKRSSMPSLEGEYYANMSIDQGAFNSLDTLNTWLSGFTPAATAPLSQPIDFPVDGGNDSTTDNPFAGIGVDAGTDNIVALWTGQLYVPLAGLTDFWTASDDGSMLWVDGNLVVSNNYWQAVTERGGSIDLTEGLHDIVIGWYEGTGGAGVTASWKPVGGEKELIPFGQEFYVIEQLLGEGTFNVGSPTDDRPFAVEIPLGEQNLLLTVTSGNLTFTQQERLTSIPEPATCLLLAGGLLSLLRKRRRTG